MSDLQQAYLISGGIFVAMMATGYGRRALTTRRIVLAPVLVGFFGYQYLGGAPTVGADLTLYAVALGLGVVFGGLVALTTRVLADRTTGAVLTVTGPAFALVWLLVTAMRIGFVYAVTNDAGFRREVGTFMYHHQLSQGAIAPSFVLMALAMVLVRLGSMLLRARALRRAAAVDAGQHRAPAALTR